MPERRQNEAARRLLERLESYEQLHVIVRMASAPGRRWTLSELGEEDDDADLQAVSHLVRAGLLERHADGGLSLSTEPWVAEGASQLLRSYRENPLPIVKAMTDRAMARLRSATARTFADAFVLRRKDD